MPSQQTDRGDKTLDHPFTPISLVMLYPHCPVIPLPPYPVSYSAPIVPLPLYPRPYPATLSRYPSIPLPRYPSTPLGAAWEF
jgi:hypothetical protein